MLGENCLGVWLRKYRPSRFEDQVIQDSTMHYRGADSGVPRFFTVLIPAKLRAFQSIEAGRNVEPGSRLVSSTHYCVVCNSQTNPKAHFPNRIHHPYYAYYALPYCRFGDKPSMGGFVVPGLSFSFRLSLFPYLLPSAMSLISMGRLTVGCQDAY